MSKIQLNDIALNKYNKLNELKIRITLVDPDEWKELDI
jgi:hypothetical protein